MSPGLGRRSRFAQTNALPVVKTSRERLAPLCHGARPPSSSRLRMCSSHVQALLWMMLAPIFPDLRREEYAPQVGPIQPRVDFGIPSLRLLIEAKFARTRAALKETVNEIAQDNSNYFTTTGVYDRLLVFVWDNGAHSEDHALVREGMRKFDRVVDAIIVARPGHMIELPLESGTTGTPE